MGGSLDNSPLGVVEWVSEVVSFKTGVPTLAIDIRLHLVLFSGVFLIVTLLGVRVVYSFIYSCNVLESPFCG